MPKLGAMAQLSRPYQIALAALVLFAAVWFVALGGHAPNSTGGSGSSPAASTPAPSAKAAAPSSAPGVQGLSRAIAKAKGAVATSQQNAKQLEQKAAQASGATATTAPTVASGASSTTSRSTKSTSSTPSATAPAARGTATPARPAMQATVEKELRQGNVVALLFWNPKGADDVIVHRELQGLLAQHRRVAAGTAHANKLVVHEALAGQVASFGTITRGVQVYGTPTLLIVNKHGVATTLTGLQDSYSIHQAIEEARKS